MPFKRFGIPPKDPEKMKKGGMYLCNRRVRIGEEETYCEILVSSSTRCPEHNVGEIARTAREEAQLRRIVDPTSVSERVAELQKDFRNLTRLDELVLNSLATLQELEKRFPISTIQPHEAVTIARLREKHAALVHQRVDLEAKLRTLLDTDFIYEGAAKLFEKEIVETNTRKLLLRGIGTLLNEIVATGSAQESKLEVPNA